MKGRTYGTLFLHATGQYWYMADTEPHINIKLKSIFPKIAKMMVPPFCFENSKENCADLYWFSQRYALRITDDDEQALVAGKDRFYQPACHGGHTHPGVHPAALQCAARR